MKKRMLSVVVVIVLLLTMIVGVTAAQAKEPIVFKIAFTDAAMTKIGDLEVPHPSYAAMLAFKNSLEKSTSGEIVVELHPGGVLGDAKSNLEQILAGQLQGATPADGAVAPFYADIQAFAIPYLFKDSLQAYDLLDSKLAHEIYEDMAATSGLRVLAAYDNGGFRNFSNSKRRVKSASDMEGLKIRTMDIAAHMEMVKALGASPTPIAFLELYSALQTGVVDGQENSAITTFSASLQEVQKYYTLDGHMLGIAYLVTGEEFYQSLSKEQQDAVIRAGIEAEIAARGAVRAYESIALNALTDAGMEVYAPTSEELETFKVSQEPVINYLKENINADYVDRVLAYIDNYGRETRVTESSAEETKDIAASVDALPQNNTLIYVLIGVIVLLIAFFIYYVVKRKKSAI